MEVYNIFFIFIIVQNNVWRFDISASKWRCLAGSQSSDPVATTSPSFVPGGISSIAGMMSMGSNNLLYIFGGFGYSTSSTKGSHSNLYLP